MKSQCSLQVNNYITLFPKRNATFLKLPFLGEECRSVDFGSNFICTLLLVTICQKPYSKFPHRSCTVRGHVSTSHSCNFTKLDASSEIERCLSFWEECMSENVGVTQPYHEFTWQQYGKDPIQKLLMVVSQF